MSISQEATQLQHPHLAEFCDVDMEMVEITLGLCLTPDYLMLSETSWQVGSSIGFLSLSSHGWL